MPSHCEHLQFEIKRSVAHISLNWPPDNLLNIAFIEEILQTLEEISESRRVKVLLLTSKLKDFCLGFDFSDHDEKHVFQLVDGFHNIMRTMHDLGLPTVSVVNGGALGAGCTLATFCDFVMSTESGRFGHPEIAFGLTPTVSTITFPHIMGMRKAIEILLTGQVLDAREAQALGLISRVLNEREILNELESLLGRITQHSVPALRVALQSIRQSVGLGLKSALAQNQSRYLEQLMDLQDAYEGIAAIKEKRQPHWKNR